MLTAEFCNNVLGKEASKRAERFRLGNKLLTLKNAVEIVLREHYFSAAWMFSSLLRTRVQRFLECFKTLLIALFLDSLIYGIFFPSDGKCETYQTKQTCLVPQAKLGGNQCVWEKEAAIRCAPKEPPGNVITILILALVITILIRPPMILIDLVAKACECRPRFESWSRLWSTNSWIGSLHHPSYLDYSPLAMAFVHHDKTKKLQEDDAAPTVTSSSSSNLLHNEDALATATNDNVDVELGTYRLIQIHTLLLSLLIFC